MNKIWLIIKREYLTRVKSKTFILTTLLAPLGFILFFFVVVLIMKQGSDDKKKIMIVDSENILQKDIDTRDNIEFEFTDANLDALKEEYKDKTFDGILEILPIQGEIKRDYTVLYHSDNQLAIDESSSLSSSIRKKIRDHKIQLLGLDNETLNQVQTSVTVEPKTILKEKKISSMTAVVSSVLGGIVGYALFIILIIYGTQVMRSVMEEKINRIVEVLVSSVTPFQLMMGKVIGVGLVGLTQIAIWILLIGIGMTIAQVALGIDTSTMMADRAPTDMLDQAQIDEGMSKMIMVFQELKSVNWLLIIPLFIFYFFAGYFAYAALFAAVGSAVGENINEANSLTLPIMMPLMAAVYIAMSAISAPNSSMAEWSSMIPLLSSVVMPVRLPSDPPAWQIIVSMVSLLLFTVFITWFAGRIYRIGILMYGKKASFKELAKWVFYKG